jgi:hypothetical protein
MGGFGEQNAHDPTPKTQSGKQIIDGSDMKNALNFAGEIT